MVSLSRTIKPVLLHSELSASSSWKITSLGICHPRLVILELETHPTQLCLSNMLRVKEASYLLSIDKRISAFVYSVYCCFQMLAQIGLRLLNDSGPLCGKDCVEIVHHIPLECAEAYGCFLTSLLKSELKGIQRGVIYSALREVQVPSQAERTLHSTKEALPSLCSANLTRDVEAVGLIKG